MRTIKFKGETLTGEIVYGDLRHDGDNVFVNDKRVKPHTVRQLAGFDENGNEVYEHDTVISCYTGAEFVPVIEVYCHLNDRDGWEDVVEVYGEDMSDYTLEQENRRDNE